MSKIKQIFLVCVFVCSVNLFADVSEIENFSAQSNQKKSSQTYNKSKNNNCMWTPHFTFVNNIQPKSSWFFQSNIGAGFLYFSGLSATLGGSPSANFPQVGAIAPIEGGLSYNRSPLFEYLLGHRFNSWFKLGLSYQFQGQVNIQSQSTQEPAAVASIAKKFTSNWSVNAFMAKVYFELPWPMIWVNQSFSPYIAVGVGPGWQTWSRNGLNRLYMPANGAAQSRGLTFRDKVSANCVWGVDAGFRMQNAKNPSIFSVVAGCKYNQWGQAREIGQLSQQGSFKYGLQDPLKVKMVYSFAPYLGVQWNFTTTEVTKTKYMVKGKDPASYKSAYFAKLCAIQQSEGIFNELNVGLGFLYTDRVNYNLDGSPGTEFAATSADFFEQGRLKYNKTSLLQWVLGYRFFNWLRAGVSYSYQNGVTVSTPYTVGVTQGTNVNSRCALKSNLMINSIMAKVYFELPHALIWANFATSPYIAFGVGPAWQTLNNTYVYRSFESVTTFVSEPQTLREKVSTSCAWMADVGLRMQGVYPSQQFSFLVGCKYNQWGQVLNVGKQTQQGSAKYALTHPLRIRTLFSFAPYLGAQWDFPTANTTQTAYKLKGKSPSTWKPYFVKSCLMAFSKGMWTQFNVGINFLYFDRVKGNLMGQPVANFSARYNNAPVKGNLMYNKSPLFEYLLGCRHFRWMSSALSYQYQNSAVVQTRQLSNPTAGQASYSQFTGTLALHSIMAKLYFELPYAMISRNMAATLYLAVGAGPSWQSWTNVNINRQGDNGIYFAATQPLNQKTSANCAWMADVGIKVSSAYPNSKFSILKGVKYNQWGQARSMGKITQQNFERVGIVNPVSIRTVYSFAPYVGFQWNF